MRFHQRDLAHLAAMVFAFGAVVATSSADSFQPSDNWPQFRGLEARGIGTGQPPPSWNVPRGENVKWRQRIPGLGHSSPIIWGDRVFVTTSISGKLDPGLRVGLYGDIWSVIDDTEHTYRVYCLSRDTGEIIWEKTSYVGVPKVKRHTKATHANCTPATDGKQVVAFFASEGLYCYTIDGELLWKKDFGVLDSGFFRVPVAQWEFASSPVIDGDRVIILCDVQKDSFIAAFDLKTGKELWRTPRKDVPTWGTPTVHRSGSRHQVIANGFNFMAGFDAKTGERLWWLAGGGDIPVPTPIVADDLVYLTSSHGGPRPVFAVKTSATGEITLKEGETSNEHVAWFRPNSAAYMQTPLAVDGLVYTCMDNGVLTCMDAKTGSVRFKARVGSGQTGFTASSVYADGRLFLTSEDGDIYVYAAGPEEKLLATNEIGEICMATPAISRGDLFVRTDKHLYCIGK